METATEAFGNDPNATLHTTVTTAPAAGTVETWSVDILPGPVWPTIGSGVQTRVRIDDEIVIFTDGTTTTGTRSITVVRGAEGSTPTAHGAGTPIYQVVTNESLLEHPVLGFLRYVRRDVVPPPGGYIVHDVTTVTIVNSRDTVAAMTAASQQDMLASTTRSMAMKFNTGDFSGMPLAARVWVRLTGYTSQDDGSELAVQIFSDSSGSPDAPVASATTGLAYNAARNASIDAGTDTVVQPFIAGNWTGTPLAAHTNYWLVARADLPAGPLNVTMPYGATGTGNLKTSNSDAGTWAAVSGFGYFDLYGERQDIATFSTDVGSGISVASSIFPALKGHSSSGSGVAGDSINGDGISGTGYGAGAGVFGDNVGYGAGVRGRNLRGGPGVWGEALNNLADTSPNVAGQFTGGRAQLLLDASRNLQIGPPGNPAWVAAGIAVETYTGGEFFMDHACNLYVCVQGGTPGTWIRVGASNPLTTQTADYAVGISDELVIVNAASKTMTLPDPATVALAEERIILNGTGTLTTVATAAGTIHGATSIAAAGGRITYKTDQTDWYQVAA